MMNRMVIIVICCCFCFIAKSQESNAFYELGKKYLTQSDFINAETNLRKALELDSTNIQIKKELAICLNYSKKYPQALEILNPLIDNDSLSDEQCYQIAGNAFKAMNQLNQCEQLFLKALQKFPQNGAIHNEIGELLELEKNNLCIDYWEKGIKVDPNYPANYYHAAKYYFEHQNIPWVLLYGEIFANLESYSLKTIEIKEILLKSNRIFFTQINHQINSFEHSPFEQKFINCFYKQQIDTTIKIDVLTLTKMRTKFILNWFQDNVYAVSFQLFSFHQFLLREGLFDAYNQWLFGAADKLINFQRWTQLHDLEYNSFLQYQGTNIFKIPPGEYYH